MSKTWSENLVQEEIFTTFCRNGNSPAHRLAGAELAKLCE
jgi:hypothetical protein